MASFPSQMNLSGGPYHTPTFFDYIPSNFKTTRHRQRTCSKAMAHGPTQESTARSRKTSTADSGVGIQEEHPSKNEPLYGDLKDFLTEQQKDWLLTRDVELARPLQQMYRAYEADISMQIRKTECERERKYNQRRREMHGATGLTKVSWSLYKLKARVCSKWEHHQLHSNWKHRHLNAKKNELLEQYVQAQTKRRMTFLRRLLNFADAEGVEDRDDGGYERDGMLNYIMTGYNSLFPISRELELEVDVPWKRGGSKMVDLFDRNPPYYGWGF